MDSGMKQSKMIFSRMEKDSNHVNIGFIILPLVNIDEHHIEISSIVTNVYFNLDFIQLICQFPPFYIINNGKFFHQ